MWAWSDILSLGLERRTCAVGRWAAAGSKVSPTAKVCKEQLVAELAEKESAVADAVFGDISESETVERISTFSKLASASPVVLVIALSPVVLLAERRWLLKVFSCLCAFFVSMAYWVSLQ